MFVISAQNLVGVQESQVTLQQDTMAQRSAAAKGMNPDYQLSSSDPLVLKIRREEAPLLIQVNDAVRGVPVLENQIDIGAIRMQEVP